MLNITRPAGSAQEPALQTWLLAQGEPLSSQVAPHVARPSPKSSQPSSSPAPSSALQSKKPVAHVGAHFAFVHAAVATPVLAQARPHSPHAAGEARSVSQPSFEVPALQSSNPGEHTGSQAPSVQVELVA
jgi:hypothetical protein